MQKTSQTETNQAQAQKRLDEKKDHIENEDIEFTNVEGGTILSGADSDHGRTGDEDDAGLTS